MTTVTIRIGDVTIEVTTDDIEESEATESSFGFSLTSETQVSE